MLATQTLSVVFCWYLGGHSIPAIGSYDEKYTQRGHGFSPYPLMLLLGWCTLGGAVVPTAPTELLALLLGWCT